MELIAEFFIILFIFWPLTLILGVGKLFSRDLSLSDKVRLGIRRVFIFWCIWAGILGFIYWQDRQPIFWLPEIVSHSAFFLLGLISGSITLTWMFHRYQRRWIRLSEMKKLDDLRAMTPDVFEVFIAGLFKAYGYQAQVSRNKSDHGVDVRICTDRGETWIVQCKRYSGSVGEPVIRDLCGTMQHEEAERAFLFTTGSFTEQAINWAEGKPIVLYDGYELVKFIRRTNKRAKRIRL